MKHYLVILSVVVGLLFLGCGAAEEEAPPAEVMRDVAEAPSAAPGERLGLDQPTATERLILRSASLDLVVDDTEEAADRINSMVSELGGFVVTSQLVKYEDGVRADMTVRVPAEALEAFLDQLRDLAQEVRRQNVSGQDVTEEYTDLQAQLRHLEATENRLLDLMDEAEDTEATLAVFSELQRVQGEIERVKGRIQFLEQSSALSTVDISLIPDALAQPISIAGWRPQGTLRDAFRTLLRALQVVVDLFIWLVVLILPIVLVVLGPPTLVLIWLLRRRRNQRGESTE
jgi:hypothetical protein